MESLKRCMLQGAHACGQSAGGSSWTGTLEVQCTLQLQAAGPVPLYTIRCDCSHSHPLGWRKVPVQYLFIPFLRWRVFLHPDPRGFISSIKARSMPSPVLGMHIANPTRADEEFLEMPPLERSAFFPQNAFAPLTTLLRGERAGGSKCRANRACAGHRSWAQRTAARDLARGGEQGDPTVQLEARDHGASARQ